LHSRETKPAQEMKPKPRSASNHDTMPYAQGFRCRLDQTVRTPLACGPKTLRPPDTTLLASDSFVVAA
jgi:hypothetical protein